MPALPGREPRCPSDRVASNGLHTEGEYESERLGFGAAELFVDRAAVVAHAGLWEDCDSSRPPATA